MSPNGLAPVPEAPLSPLQLQFWLLEELNPDVRMFNIPFALRLGGPLDVAALERALDAVTNRHELLSTVFTIGPDGMPGLRRIDTGLPKLAKRSVPAGGWRDAAIADALERFPLEDAPLWRVVLYDEGDPAQHVLVLTMHHGISDAQSLTVLVEDLREAYAAEVRGEQPDWPPAGIPYARAAAAEHERLADEEQLAPSLAFWRAALEGVAAHAPLLLDESSPAFTQRIRGAVSDRLTGADLERLMRLVPERKASPYALVTAGTAQALAAVAGRSQAVLGIPIFNRREPDVERTVGLFTDVMLLYVRRADAPFSEVLQDVRDGLLDALMHADIPYQRLIHELAIPRVPGRRGSFDAAVHLRRKEGPVAAGGLTWISEPVEMPVASFDVSFNYLIDTEFLELVVSYDAEVISEPLAKRLCAAGLHALRVAPSC